jgi:hypothetical protein
MLDVLYSSISYEEGEKLYINHWIKTDEFFKIKSVMENIDNVTLLKKLESLINSMYCEVD